MQLASLLIFLLEFAGAIAVSFALGVISICIVAFCWRWKTIRLVAIGVSLLLQVILWFGSSQPDRGGEMMASAARAIDRNGNEVPREHWILPEDYKHDFRDGPALDLKKEDFWQTFLVRTEQPHEITTYFLKDKNEIRIVHQYGKHRKRYYVDERGKPVFNQTFEFARPFSEGLAVVSKERGPGPIKYFIDRTGKIAFPGKFAEVSEFHCGRAFVIPCTSTRDSPISVGRQVCNPICIDTHGKKVFDCDFTWMGEYSDGCAPVFTEGNPDMTGLIDVDGKFLVRGIKFENFSEGLGAFKDLETGLYGYADRKGTICIQPQFHYADEFREGRAVVGLRRTTEIPKWQLEEVTYFQFDGRIPYNQRGMQEFDGRYAAAYVTQQGKLLNIQLLDPKGEIRHAKPFHHGVAYINLYTDREIDMDLGLHERIRLEPPRFVTR